MVIFGNNMSQQPLRTVLIVDDESSIREMLAVALEMAGFETIQAENASSAPSVRA